MKKYDVIIIGGGPAGLVASKVLIAFGKKVAIVEAHKLGGDCTHTGCVPSKTLLKAAKAVYDAQHLEKYGVTLKSLELDTSNVLQHVRSVVDEIYAHETPEVFKTFGIDTIEGYANFTSSTTIEVSGVSYEAKEFIIATGSRPSLPNIEGIESVNYLTNENIFTLEQIPNSMIIVGTGVIAIEMATAFNRLGSKVSIVSRSSGILKGNDSEMTQILLSQLKHEGIQFIDGATFNHIKEDGGVVLNITRDGKEEELHASKILFATGRTPNTNLGLEEAGVAYDAKGVKVNDKLQTTNPNIYAMGGCLYTV